ncbi:MAG: 2-oxoacid:acceptor oxidoreductase family protein, partial [Chloroflexi bacterium]|nr:2-oxoacid:acceptor oxidoreductase family protein [Chloroflexota bacterium]
PRVNESGFYEMRFEAIGGLGANLAGQVLAQALVLGQGLNGAHFSTYGSEKKGSPVKSHIRLCAPDREVRTSNPIDRPHLLALFHPCLLKVEGTARGLYPDSVIVVNSPDPLDDVRYRAKIFSGTLAVIDALGIAVRNHTRINTAMLGAIVRASGFIDPEPVKNAIAGLLGKGKPNLVQSNLNTFQEGFEQVQVKELEPDERFNPETAERHAGYVHGLGYASAPAGGVILNSGNTVLKDLSASRQGIFPLFHRDRCIDCGLCTQTCPDFVFVWEPGLDRKGARNLVLKGPDLQYCKGCLRCVPICPTQALTIECERPEFAYTADAQLWGPPEALSSMGEDNAPARWEQKDGYWWYRVG